MPKKRTDALEILDRRYFRTKEQQAELAEARASAEVARRIYELRTKGRLTQAQLAKFVGTSRSVISRLEDDDYDGHSLAMLQRIAAALDQRVEIRFVPLHKKRRTP